MNEYTTGAIIGIGFVAAANGLLVFTCTVAVMVITGLIVRYLPQMAAWNRQRRAWKQPPTTGVWIEDGHDYCWEMVKHYRDGVA
jgi:hypothetical protein